MSTRHVRALLHKALHGFNFKKSRDAYALLGCSHAQLMRYLGPKPPGNFHLDHIAPLACALNEEEALKLNHYSNLQWLPAAENLAKSDRWTEKGAMLHLILLGRVWPNPDQEIV